MVILMYIKHDHERKAVNTAGNVERESSSQEVEEGNRRKRGHRKDTR